MNIKDIADRILCVVFPRRCKYCGTVIRPTQYVCSECRQTLPKIEPPVCFYCGKNKNDCECRKKSSYYDRIVAPFYYSGAVETAVRRMKFREHEFLCSGYAEDMAQCVDKHYGKENFDIICYVPFGKKDFRKRDFNQSEVLARYISGYLGIPLSNAIIKLYGTSVQHRLGGQLRNGNVFAAFDIKDAGLVEGKRVLLVDDIKTTGATLNECAKMLRIYGAKSVDCVCFAVAVKKQNIDTAE